ncbi:MAG: hypothetical protein R2827_11540 [Bdellovibrionales bacterium]
MNTQKWKSLNSLGKKSYKPIWSYVASRNQGKPANAPRSGCGKYFNPNERTFKRPKPSECDDALFITTLDWVLSKINAKEIVNLKTFGANTVNSGSNSVSLQPTIKMIYAGMFFVNRPSEPTHTELLLALPRNKPFQELTGKPLS